MKTSLSICIVGVLTIGNLLAQTPKWQWAKGFGGDNWESPYRMCADKDGNIFVYGSFASSNFKYYNYTLSGNKYGDFFLLKINKDGNLIWARNSGDTSSTTGTGITTDTKGNIYITGTSSSPNFIFGNDTLKSNGKPFAFLLKYSGTGDELWGKSLTSTNGNAIGIHAVSDSAGNIYWDGHYSKILNYFGNQTTSHGSSDIFLVKLDTSGKMKWFQTFGGTGFDEAYGMSVDRDRIYLGGRMEQDIQFGSKILHSNGLSDAFTACLDSSGTTNWCFNYGGTNADQVYTLKLFNGRIYAGGDFSSDTLKAGSSTFYNRGGYDGFFICLDRNTGQSIFAKQYGGNQDESSWGLATDNQSIYLAAYTKSTNGSFGGKGFSTSGGADVLLLTYTKDGIESASQTIGGVRDEYSSDIINDNAGNIYLTGTYASPKITFGGIDVSTIGIDTNYSDGFVAKIGLAMGFPDPSFKTCISYPNPFNSHTTILYPASTGAIDFLLYDSKGMVIRTLTTPANGRLDFNRENLPLGLYYFSIINANGYISTGKLIIQE